MKKNDWIIIMAALVLAAAVYGGLKVYDASMESESKSVEVYIDGVLEEKLDLSVDGTYTYKSDYGTNVIEIQGGQVSIVEADCPDNTCVNEGSIDGVNETIVCLPHHFHILITGNQSEEVEIDGVSQ